MKISIVSNTSHTVPPKTWGGEIVLWDLYECLKELGHNVTLFAPKGSPCDIEIPLEDSANPNTEIEIYNKHNDILKSSDIVHDWSHNKIISDSLFIDGYRNFVSVLIGYYWKYPQCGVNLSVPSQTMRIHGLTGCNGFEFSPWENVMSKDVGKLTGNIEVVLFGTNTDFYTPKYEKEDYFLWVGGFSDWKGLGLSIMLAKEMKFNLILAGSIDEHPEHIAYYNHYKDIINNCPNIRYIYLPKDNNHHFVKRELLQNAKAFMFPILRDEGFGLTTIEALSCGTPLITSNRGAMAEIVKHGETGFICNKTSDLIYAIQNIDKIDMKKCRKDAIKRFDRMVMTKNYLELYNKQLETIKNI